MRSIFLFLIFGSCVGLIQGCAPQQSHFSTDIPLIANTLGKAMIKGSVASCESSGGTASVHAERESSGYSSPQFSADTSCTYYVKDDEGVTAVPKSLNEVAIRQAVLSNLPKLEEIIGAIPGGASRPAYGIDSPFGHHATWQLFMNLLIAQGDQIDLADEANGQIATSLTRHGTLIGRYRRVFATVEGVDNSHSLIYVKLLHYFPGGNGDGLVVDDNNYLNTEDTKFLEAITKVVKRQGS